MMIVLYIYLIGFAGNLFASHGLSQNPNMKHGTTSQILTGAIFWPVGVILHLCKI